MAESYRLRYCQKLTIPVGSGRVSRVAGYFGHKAKLSPAGAGAWLSLAKNNKRSSIRKIRIIQYCFFKKMFVFNSPFIRYKGCVLIREVIKNIFPYIGCVLMREVIKKYLPPFIEKKDKYNNQNDDPLTA